MDHTSFDDHIFSDFPAPINILASNGKSIAPVGNGNVALSSSPSNGYSVMMSLPLGAAVKQRDDNLDICQQRLPDCNTLLSTNAVKLDGYKSVHQSTDFNHKLNQDYVSKIGCYSPPQKYADYIQTASTNNISIQSNQLHQHHQFSPPPAATTIHNLQGKINHQDHLQHNNVLSEYNNSYNGMHHVNQDNKLDYEDCVMQHMQGSSTQIYSGALSPHQSQQSQAQPLLQPPGTAVTTSAAQQLAKHEEKISNNFNCEHDLTGSNLLRAGSSENILNIPSQGNEVTICQGQNKRQNGSIHCDINHNPQDENLNSMDVSNSSGGGIVATMAGPQTNNTIIKNGKTKPDEHCSVPIAETSPANSGTMINNSISSANSNSGAPPPVSTVKKSEKRKVDASGIKKKKTR